MNPMGVLLQEAREAKISEAALIPNFFNDLFKSLLSYNEDDLDCIYKFFPTLFEGIPLYPIGTDAAGNFICYDTNNQNYVLLNHETNTQELITLN